MGISTTNSESDQFNPTVSNSKKVAAKTGGDLYYYPNFNIRDDGEQLHYDLSRVMLRPSAFGCHLKVRTSRGLTIDKMFADYDPLSVHDQSAFEVFLTDCLILKIKENIFVSVFLKFHIFVSVFLKIHKVSRLSGDSCITYTLKHEDLQENSKHGYIQLAILFTNVHGYLIFKGVNSAGEFPNTKKKKLTTLGQK